MAGAAAAALGPEAAYWLAARAQARPAPGEPCAVLVLGTSDPRGQERRVSTGLEAAALAACGRLVLSGGKPHSERPEAEGMADAARRLGAPAGLIALEPASRSTWENVKFSLPLLEGYPRVYVVSNALHARRGLRYLCRQAPERCADARAYGYYRLGQDAAYKWRGAWHELGAYVKYR